MNTRRTVIAANIKKQIRRLALTHARLRLLAFVMCVHASVCDLGCFDHDHHARIILRIMRFGASSHVFLACTMRSRPKYAYG
jgi:hypothetical protein